MLVEAGGDTGIQEIGKICEKKEIKLKQDDQRKEKSFLTRESNPDY